MPRSIPSVPAQIQQALLLAADHGPAGAGRHEQRLDAERVAGAEQLACHGVPQGEREHAAQPGQRRPGPSGGRPRRSPRRRRRWRIRRRARRQFRAQFEVVVDLAVEHQHVPVRGLRRTPAQRLVAVRDVDDRQPVEAQHHWRASSSDHVPGLVGTTVAHQVRRARHRVDEVISDGSGRVSTAGPAVRTPRQYAQSPVHRGRRRELNTAGVSSLATWAWSTLRSIRLCVSPTVSGGANVTARGLTFWWRSRRFWVRHDGACSAAAAGRRPSASGWPNGITPEAHAQPRAVDRLGDRRVRGRRHRLRPDLLDVGVPPQEEDATPSCPASSATTCRWNWC